MSVILDLNPEIERDLLIRASERGLSINEFLQEVVAREVGSTKRILTGEEKARAFLEWADSFPTTPLLSDEAISRDSMYPDR